MENKFYYVVILRDELEAGILEELIQSSQKEYHSQGYEEYSLDEGEVDKILGNEAFCGGDLSESLMSKLEADANKSFKFYFTGEDSQKNSKNFEQFLINKKHKFIEWVEKEEEDWNESWKVHYEPIFLNDLVVLPVWDADKEVGEKKKIIINPGMGFGTGTHETTRQCLLLLLDEVSEGAQLKNCLDFGSGSGILGISYQKFLNGPVDFVDIDERALDNNKDNSKLNFPAGSQISNYILREDYKLTQKYDLVFANILEHVLTEEFKTIKDTVNTGKTLIVSGLLNEQRDNIEKLYSSEFKVKSVKSEGDWSAIAFIKL